MEMLVLEMQAFFFIVITLKTRKQTNKKDVQSFSFLSEEHEPDLDKQSSNPGSSIY